MKPASRVVVGALLVALTATGYAIGDPSIVRAMTTDPTASLETLLGDIHRRLDDHEARLKALESAPEPTPPPPPSGPVQKTGALYAPIQSLSGSTLAAKLDGASGKILSLEPKTVSMTDFASAYGAPPYFAGAKIPATVRGISGTSRDTSVIEMVPRSSTKSTPTTGTNPLYYLASLDTAGEFLMEDLTLRGTDQGHIYNGVYLARPKGKVTVRRANFFSIPGNAGAPPGETFFFNLYKQPAGQTAVFEDLVFDGKGVGAAGLGTNNTQGLVEIHNVTAKNMGYSAGVALWQVGPNSVVNVRNLVMSGNKRNFGAECLAGTVNIYDPVWGDPRADKFDVNLTYGTSSGQTWKNGKINFHFSSDAAWQRFIAPRVNKKIKVVTNPYQPYGNPLMPAGSFNDLWSGVSVYVGGVKKTTTDYVVFTGRRS